MTRRILAVTIAIVIATLGTAGVLYYALTADARARASIHDAVTVAIATTRIPTGTTGAAIRAGNMVRLVRMPKSSVPGDALSSIDASYDTEVVTSDISMGQVLLAANFGPPSQATSGLTLPQGMMAVTVQTGAPEQVAGYVRPGSQVVIFLTYHPIDGNGNTQSSIQRTRVLLPKVEVVAVGTYTPPTNGQSGTSGASQTSASGTLLLTLAVDQTSAERLVNGMSTGSLYLGLLTGSTTVTPNNGVQNTDTAGGVSPIFK